MRKIIMKQSSVLLWVIAALPFMASSQVTFPINGVAEPKDDYYVFTHAVIVKDAQTTLPDATLVIKEGKIIAVGKDIPIPKEAVTIDCKGKYIYPSFIDIYSDYGIDIPVRPSRSGYRGPSQLTSNTKGAFGWNQALRSEVDGYKIFTVDKDKAEKLRSSGFGAVLTHQKDGIARGTGTVVSLSEEKENLVMLKERASANYSFSKGSSTQSYPTSLMGSIALLRQTYLDGQWYKTNPPGEGINISLQAWNQNQDLPQIFEANDKWNDIRADRVGDEFGIQYILKGGGNEYQRLEEVKATNAAFIIPLNFPQAMDVEDPNEARYVSLADLKHWEMAPSNPAAMEKAGINFCITAADLKDTKDFLANLRKALQYGLSEKTALEALTKIPATLLGMYDEVGSIEAGKLADFLITNEPLFNEKAKILQNWVQGKKYDVEADNWTDIRGSYTLSLSGPEGKQNYNMDVKSEKSVVVLIGNDSLPGKLSFNGKLVQISFPLRKKSNTTIRLSGAVIGDQWHGTGEDTAGLQLAWSASFNHPPEKKADTAPKKMVGNIGKVYYPFDGYGWETLPKQENLLVRNATVWTNEKEGILHNADVLVKNGKIAAVGKGLSAQGARIIDGTGKYLSPGIVDEHSHIATVSINEGGQSVTSEVRIKDNLDPEDIDIYRQLSGGVTTSHILHGSANTIGGQTQLIKLRWGVDDKGLMFQGWKGFIKFALGENVKRSSSSNNNRYPDTRMGVEQVLSDAFQRATDYKNALAEAKDNNRKKGAPPESVRRDLELDALVEILDGERNITCHSYIQSEITAAMRVADKYGFRFNTFTHVLEGYKIADKLKAHGANVSTFSDWWEYKSEVIDAIPYNASIMHAVGLNVAINSDDPEMARRLNQEAAKSVKYGGMSEEEAFKMVTLNPARMLHVDDRIGSIRVGKDADLVLWSDDPLSIYAVAEKTIVDGIVYFDRERDLELRGRIQKERNRLIQKMISEKKSGAPVKPATPSMKITNSCGDHLHSHGLFVTNGDNELSF